MLIDVIQDDAERKFIASLEAFNRTPINHGILHCRFSKIPLTMSAESMLRIVRNTLSGMEASLYMYKDGDVFITWKGPIRQVLTELSSVLAEHFARYLSDAKPASTVGSVEI